MRLRPTLIFLIIAVVTSVAAAQSTERSVAVIRERYNDIAEKARATINDDDAAFTGPLVVNELTINSRNRQWRAVGTYSRSVRFFYSDGDSDQSLYPDRLVFTTVISKHSATETLEEFLFSESGSLIFYFRKASGDEWPVERRIYFNGAATLRIIADGKTRDRLTRADMEAAKAAIKSAENIRKVFLSSLKM